MVAATDPHAQRCLAGVQGTMNKLGYVAATTILVICCLEAASACGRMQDTCGSIKFCHSMNSPLVCCPAGSAGGPTLTDVSKSNCCDGISIPITHLCCNGKGYAPKNKFVCVNGKPVYLGK